eukprot:5944442-Amphidinium_carterae.1
MTPGSMQAPAAVMTQERLGFASLGMPLAQIDEMATKLHLCVFPSGSASARRVDQGFSSQYLRAYVQLRVLDPGLAHIQYIDISTIWQDYAVQAEAQTIPFAVVQVNHWLLSYHAVLKVLLLVELFVARCELLQLMAVCATSLQKNEVALESLWCGGEKKSIVGTLRSDHVHQEHHRKFGTLHRFLRESGVRHDAP